MAQNNIIAQIEKENLKPNAPQFNVGDTVKVYFKVIEGEKERIQVYQGEVIARKNGSIRESFTVRHNSFGIGVERTFPVHSPKIEKVEIVKQGVVRRAKLYYLRELTGKKAKIKEKVSYNKKETAKTELKKPAVKAEVNTESK